MEKYKGILIKESLTDASALENISILSTRTGVDEDDSDGAWHLYTVEVSRSEIDELQKYLRREGGWYMHFWMGRDMIVVFRDKVFEIDYDNKETWKDAVEYGRTMGIPDEQLDFLIE